MPASMPLKVVLCWHMHQPHYRDSGSGEYQLPWTYLHATKDYVDMAAIIEATPGARAVVNFAPTLLEQLDDYARQIRRYLEEAEGLKDPLLAALVSPASPVGSEQRLALINACLRANEKRVIERYPAYRLLADMARCIRESPYATHYLEQQYLSDLLVWYHIAWIGETVQREDVRIQRLIAKGRGFSHHDRLQLLEIIGELVGSVVERYRRLAQAGRIELSMTPYAHPITPLLLDLDSALDALPGAPMPKMKGYPGGAARARWHVEEGVRVFESHFGLRPTGIWPAEGGLSAGSVELFESCGFHWTASGEGVLRNSLERSGTADLQCIHRPYRLSDSKLHCFFRDDGLSDLIGFSYADWHAEDAVANLIHHLENISVACQDEPNRVVSIILDGENAWEHYPENGFHFLTALYARLAEHPGVELTTFSECVKAGLEPLPLSKMVAGSWVYGTFSTWIGDADKNRGWDLLGEVKLAFDRAVADGRLSDQRMARAEQQLAICEGSDWFWWFGDYNPSDSVRDFDRLYRLHLAELYHILGEPVPEALSHVISHGGGVPETGGVMRRGKEVG